MWLVITLFSYFFNAIVATIDKFLISKKIPHPITYTFYIGILSILSLLLIFVGGLVFPSIFYLFISLITGGLFILALFLFFHSLKANEPSRVVTLIGSFIPIFTIVLSYLILKERFSAIILVAIFFLLLGGFLMTLVRHKGKEQLIERCFLIILSSFVFALSYVLTKIIYQQLPFISGFIWIRLGSFLVTLGLLIFNKTREIISNSLRTTEKKISLLFLSNQGLSAIAFFLLNLAISLGSVSLINALQGVQYIFIFFLALLISHKFPYFFKEELNKRVIVQKILATISIFVGFLILTFYK